MKFTLGGRGWMVIRIEVECYSGYRGEETPRRFFLGSRKVEIVTVRDRWLAPDHRYFKVRGDDGGEYILRHDPQEDAWEMTFFREAGDEESSADEESLP